MNRILIAAAVLVICVAGVWVLRGPPHDPRKRAEREHGITLPPSARNIQRRGDAWENFLDRGAATLFEMEASDLAAWVGQLKVKSRTAPLQAGGDPTINGWNVWPVGSETFVPGNDQYGGFQATWQGESAPIEMLSCSSSTGDWLHVELWRIKGAWIVVKMYTDWN